MATHSEPMHDAKVDIKRLKIEGELGDPLSGKRQGAGGSRPFFEQTAKKYPFQTR